MRKYLNDKQRKLLKLAVVRSVRGEIRPEAVWRGTVTWKEFKELKLWNTSRGSMDVHIEPTEESITAILNSMQSAESFCRFGLDEKIRPFFSLNSWPAGE